MMAETTLLPCPFCGGEAEKLTSSDGFTSIGCLRCSPIFGVMIQRGSEAEAIAAWNTRAEHHVYEQRITGSGSDWGEIMCDAFDSLLASACDACTFDELERFRAYIIKEVGE